MRARAYLGHLTTLGERSTVHLCDDAIEIDLIDGYDIETKRVFFCDVQLITLHHQHSRWGLWLTGISTLIGLVIWLANAGRTEHDTGWIAFWIAFVPNLPFLFAFLRTYEYVTVFGRRTKATMCWHFRHARGRRVFDQLVGLVQQAQERERQRVAERSMAAAPILPTPPQPAEPAPSLAATEVSDHP
jgi:hypothetical protein